MNENPRVTLIRNKLTESFQPVTLEVVDESHKHAGHPGARAGGGHFLVNIVSDAFANKSLIERHRMVYAAMGDAMQTEIHALSIKASTPDEVSA